MIDLRKLSVWFITGSQHLYGEETLKQVAADAQAIAQGLGQSPRLPVSVVFKPVVTTPESILEVCREANSAAGCVGLILWRHTFSPAKMWMAGLTALHKPFLHLHTQFNRDIPWATIDMDFMNLNQSAHGDREFGYLGSRLRLNRNVVVGHWQDPEVQQRIGAWARAACAWHDAQSLKVARFGDNMRQVAVTEGDKVEAQHRFGYTVNGYGVGDLARSIAEVGDADAGRLLAEYDQRYAVAETLRPGGSQRASLRAAAQIELGLRHFLEQGGFKAFTDTFEDLHGLRQLPGLAVQRPLPPDRQPGERRPAGCAPAQAARGPRVVGARARPENRRRGLDLGRWRPPHRLQPVGHGRAPGRLRRDSGRGNALDQSRDASAGLQEGIALERGLRLKSSRP